MLKFRITFFIPHSEAPNNENSIELGKQEKFSVN